MGTRYVTIDLDRPRRLVYDLNALVEIEERLGVSVSQIHALEVSAKNIRILIWAGLVHEDPDLTIEAVGAMVSGEKIQSAMAAFGEGMKRSFGVGEATPEGNGAGAEAGTGEKPSA